MMGFTIQVPLVPTTVVVLAVALMLFGSSGAQASDGLAGAAQAAATDQSVEHSFADEDANARVQAASFETLILAWEQAASDQDVPAALALFAEGSQGEGNACLAFASTSCDLAEGWVALVAAVGDLGVVTFTVVESTTDGNTISGAFESRFDLMDQLAGEPTRNRQLFEADVVDGLITRLGWVSDFDDPITVRNEALFFEFSTNLTVPDELPNTGTGGLADQGSAAGQIEALLVTSIAAAVVSFGGVAAHRRRRHLER